LSFVSPLQPRPPSPTLFPYTTLFRSSARASGVRFTPTFFINGVRYDGPWDESSFTDAMLGSFGHRVRTAALTFASWAPSAGLLLDRKSTRLNSSHVKISYAVFCLKKK